MWINNSKDATTFLELVVGASAGKITKSVLLARSHVASLAGNGLINLTYVDLSLFCTMSLAQKLQRDNVITEADFNVLKDMYWTVRSGAIGLHSLYSGKATDFMTFIRSMGVGEEKIRAAILKHRELGGSAREVADAMRNRMKIFVDPASAFDVLSKVYIYGLGSGLGLLYKKDDVQDIDPISVMSLASNLFFINDELVSPFMNDRLLAIVEGRWESVINDDLVANVKQSIASFQLPALPANTEFPVSF